MDKLLHDSLTVHLENFGYKDIPKLENIIPKLKDYNETISSINYMLGVPRFILDMSDEEFEKLKENPDWRKGNKDIWKGFEEPVSIKEKEDNKMITAEEARNIADESNIKDILENINENIKLSAEIGKYESLEYYNVGSNYHIHQRVIKKKLKDIGYDVNIRLTNESMDINLYKLYDLCMCISWKRGK